MLEEVSTGNEKFGERKLLTDFGTNKDIWYRLIFGQKCYELLVKPMYSRMPNTHVDGEE
jgi:hypothetical protein